MFKPRKTRLDTGTYVVKKTIFFCYGHRLLNYDGPCRHIHGHNGKIEMECASARLDKRGMVIDFLDMAHIIKTWIDAHFDHTLLLRKDDPLIPLLKQSKERFFVTEENPTAEHLAKLIFEFARSKNLPVTAVTLWETEHASATYREKN